jgi:hypothetical protein
VFEMCYMEDIFHTKCGHWGRQRFSGEPCIRSRIVDGRHTGCSYLEVIGMANSDQPCWLCKRVGGSDLPLASSTASASLLTIPQQPRRSSDAMSRTALFTSLPSQSQTSGPECNATTDRSPASRPISLEDLHRLSFYGKICFIK